MDRPSANVFMCYTQRCFEYLRRIIFYAKDAWVNQDFWMLALSLLIPMYCIPLWVFLKLVKLTFLVYQWGRVGVTDKALYTSTLLDFWRFFKISMCTEHALPYSIRGTVPGRPSILITNMASFNQAIDTVSGVDIGEELIIL